MMNSTISIITTTTSTSTTNTSFVSFRFQFELLIALSLHRVLKFSKLFVVNLNCTSHTIRIVCWLLSINCWLLSDDWWLRLLLLNFSELLPHWHDTDKIINPLCKASQTTCVQWNSVKSNDVYLCYNLHLPLSSHPHPFILSVKSTLYWNIVLCVTYSLIS